MYIAAFVAFLFIGSFLIILAIDLLFKSGNKRSAIALFIGLILLWCEIGLVVSDKHSRTFKIKTRIETKSVDGVEVMRDTIYSLHLK